MKKIIKKEYLKKSFEKVFLIIISVKLHRNVTKHSQNFKKYFQALL